MKSVEKMCDESILSEILSLLFLQNLTTLSLLKEENEALHHIIELLPGNVYWKNLEGKLLGCNMNVAKIAGFESPAQLIGKDTVELFGEVYGASAKKNDEEVITLGKELNYEEYGPGLNNLPATYLSRKLPLYNSLGVIIGTMGIALDITDRKKMEEELKVAKEKAETSNRVKSQFVAAVNHELRTPLASIIGLVDLLKSENTQESEGQKIIESIENSAQHLLNLVNDLLDFSKLESGKQQLQITPVDFPALVAEVCDLLKPLAKDKGLMIITINPPLPFLLMSDARILRHILINLINNAIKYTEKGRVTIHVQPLEKSKDKVKLRLSISDTGAGIPANKIDTIFRAFQQLTDNNARQSSRSGTGLGLTIVKKLAEAINATLLVESEIDKGSTFSVTAEFLIQDKELLSPNNHENQLHVLVVEDDPIIQYIHKKLLVNLQCHVDVVANAHDAMKVLNQHHDIIFLDMSLPDVNGYELIKMIRQTTAFDCPIVVISAFIDQEDEAACLKAGANEFVSKPISQIKLKHLLARYCGQRQSVVQDR